MNKYYTIELILAYAGEFREAIHNEVRYHTDEDGYLRIVNKDGSTVIYEHKYIVSRYCDHGVV